MKVVQVIGVIGLFVILGMGACAWFVWGAIGELQDLPPYATREAIEERMGTDLDAIRARLDSDEDLQYASGSFELGDDILAILREGQDGFISDDDDAYGRFSVEKSGHVLLNGAGTVGAEVDGRSSEYLGYEIEDDDKTYLVIVTAPTE